VSAALGPEDVKTYMPKYKQNFMIIKGLMFIKLQDAGGLQFSD